jgi:hypothetical protein
VFAERLIVLKKCYFRDKVFLLPSLYIFTYSPSVNGFDFFAIIFGIAKLA